MIAAFGFCWLRSSVRLCYLLAPHSQDSLKKPEPKSGFPTPTFPFVAWLCSPRNNGKFSNKMDSTLNYHAKKKGFRPLLEIGDYVQMPLGGLTASNASIQSRTSELKRVMRSLQTAKRALLQSKEKSIDLIMRTIRVDREVADEMFADNRRNASGNGVPSREGMEQIVKSLQMLGQFSGRKIPLEEIADVRIARE